MTLRPGTPSSPAVRRYRIALAAHLALVAAISALAYSGRLPLPSLGASHLDLVGHAVLIGTLALLVDGSLGFTPLPLVGSRWVGLGAVIVLALAGAEELLQALSPHRSSSPSDFLADVAGGVILCTIARVLHSLGGGRR